MRLSRARAVFAPGLALALTSCFWPFDATRLNEAQPGCVDYLGAERPGTDPSACGVGGEVCRVCAGATDTCREGRCRPLHEPIAIAAGGEVSCAIESTGALWCWGGSRTSVLGTTAETATPIVLEMPEPVAQVSLGGTYTMSACALLASGRLWCWGSNGEGQLARGAVGGNFFPPVEIDAPTPWSAVAAGSVFTIAVHEGELWAWGNGDRGQTGAGRVEYRLTPTRIGTDASWWALEAADGHACALRDRAGDRGSLYCWGNDAYGQLGTGATGGPSAGPVPPTTPTGFTQVAAGADFTCGLRGEGQLFCWGRGDAGRLGLGDEAGRTVPTEVAPALAPFVAVTAGYEHACAIDSHGAVHCFGANENGQVGLPLGTDVALAPVPVLEGSVAVAIDAGAHHTCALTDEGRIYCWGRNGDSEVGSATPSSFVPTPHEVVLGRDAT